jgi:hypothetical protein
MNGGAALPFAPPAHFIDVAQKISRVFIDAIGASAFQFAG